MDTRQDAHQDTPPGEWATIAEAARSLGVSPDAIRRRIRRGTMRARRGTATHGGPPPYLVWMKALDNVRSFPDDPPGRRQDVYQERQDGRQAHQDTHQDAARTLALTQARAAEMATYSQQLLAPYVRRIEEQAEELGTLKERLATAQARIAELEAPPEAEEVEETQSQEDATPAPPEQRPWWHRAWRLVVGD